MKTPARAILIFIIIFLCCPFCVTPSEIANNAVMRVSITDDVDSVYLALKGRYKIYAAGSENTVKEGPFFSGTVSATRDGLRIGKEDIRVNAVRVRVARDSNIYLNNRRFRGDIDIFRKDNGRLMIINYIGLDKYLYGVLYHEVSHRWPMEVLKAQAIAARTFALYQARQNALKAYDLRSDIYSQVYGGRTSEKWSTTKAVNLTKGKVLSYKGDIFPAYYHATCAGYTEDAFNLWKIDIEPLKGVPCDFCKLSPHYRWMKEIPLSRIEDRLMSAGYKIRGISSFSVLSKNRSGRAERLDINAGNGTSAVLTGKDFRQIIGPNEIRSAKFTVLAVSNKLCLEGLGWGHGVGMCQWGAYGMARKGKKAEEILKYYYPGAEITTIDKVRL
ncbi:MAG: SpoIID/LytB domain-containing protein [Candidatus Omnitrophota bacterium]|nr:SpoIID/LytB domain-containing protein [Candidatus Omnitrophota bacterium]